MRLAATVLVSVFALQGCDVLYGVRREAYVTSVPSLDCIEAAISSVPGVASIERPMWPRTGTRSSPPPYYFVYRGAPDSHLQGVAQVQIEESGKLSFQNSLMDINRRPPQAEIDATRPAMQAIERALEERCGVDGLTSSIKEVCRGVECQPMR